jgi:hypothetical protein
MWNSPTNRAVHADIINVDYDEKNISEALKLLICTAYNQQMLILDKGIVLNCFEITAKRGFLANKPSKQFRITNAKSK